MTRKLGIFLFVIGLLFSLYYGIALVENITTSKEEIIREARDFIEREDIDISHLEYIMKMKQEDLTIGRVVFSIITFFGLGLFLSGLALFKIGSKYARFSGNSRLNDLFNRQNRIWARGLILFLFLSIITVKVAATFKSPAMLLSLILWVGGIIYIIRELIFFNYNFGDVHKHLLNWEYPNGDQLIVTCWGLMKYNQTVPKLSVTNKFEGFKWDFENAKDLAECLLKNEGNPLMTLLPTIEFSTTSNRIEDFITFSFVDNVNLTFIDAEEGYLIINIEKKNYSKKYTLTYPMPLSKASLQSEVELFEKRISKRKTPVRALFIDKSLLEDIRKEEFSDPEEQ